MTTTETHGSSILQARQNGTKITSGQDISSVSFSSPVSKFFISVFVFDLAGNAKGYPVTRNRPNKPPVTTGLSVTVKRFSPTSYNISWPEATDDGTPQANLLYHVYMSATNSLNSVATIVQTGTKIATGTGIRSVAVNATVLLYVNVIVLDEEGAGSVYTGDINPKIMLYSTGNSFDGWLDMGGSPSVLKASQICSSSQNAPTGYTGFNMFISLDASNTLKNRNAFPLLDTNTLIVSPKKTVLADNWGDLLNGPKVSLTASEVVVPNTLSNFWTGSMNSGEADTQNNCNNWTDRTFSRGAIGNPKTPGGGFGDFLNQWEGTGGPCNAFLPLVCVAWIP
jgi:hypothetical protein